MNDVLNRSEHEIHLWNRLYKNFCKMMVEKKMIRIRPIYFNFLSGNPPTPKSTPSQYNVLHKLYRSPKSNIDAFISLSHVNLWHAIAYYCSY